MKTIKKYNSKYLEDVIKIIVKHIKANIKDYLILSIIFVVGVMIGVILINNADDNSKKEVSGYINSFILNIKNKSFEIDRFELMKNIFMENLKFVIIIWMAGTTIIGMPLIYLIIAYKGICLGYTISSIVLALGNWKRFCIFNFCIIITKYNYYSNFINVKCKCFKFV